MSNTEISPEAKTFDWGGINAIASHAGTAILTVITMASAGNFIDHGTVTKLTDAISTLGTGMTTIEGALSSIAAVALVGYRAYLNMRGVKLASIPLQDKINDVAKAPEVSKIFATPEVAHAAPSNKVIPANLG